MAVPSCQCDLLQILWEISLRSTREIHPHILNKFGHLRDSVYHMVIGVTNTWRLASGSFYHLRISILHFLHKTMQESTLQGSPFWLVDYMYNLKVQCSIFAYNCNTWWQSFEPFDWSRLLKCCAPGLKSMFEVGDLRWSRCEQQLRWRMCLVI